MVGLALPVPAAARSFALERMAVALVVGPDGGLLVQETLTIAFRGAHRGVFRTIPTAGPGWRLRLADIQVLDEARQPLPAEVTRSGDLLRIAARVPGAVDARRTLRLLYRVRQAVRAGPEGDELRWNVTGDAWEVPIGEAEAAVRLPAGLAARARAVAYTGRRSAAGADWVEERDGDLILLRATRPLAPGEGFTVAVSWPAGAVAGPGLARRAGWLVADHWPLALPLLTLAGLGLLWRAEGRDPRLGRSVRPEYGPPAGLLPAEAGTLLDERADPREVLATLVDLGVRGYLQVSRDGDDFVFRRLRPLAGDARLRPLEVGLLQRVFGENLSLPDRRLSELTRDTEHLLEPMREAIYRSMVEARLFPASPYWVRLGWRLVAAALGLAAGAVALSGQRVGELQWSLAAGLAASALIVLAFSAAMPRRTWRGARLLVHLEGFREFLQRAEQDRLERLPADTLHRWLPWAIALGVSDAWLARFERAKVTPPVWYQDADPFSLTDYRDWLGRLGTGIQVAWADAGGGWSAGGGGSSGGAGSGMGGGGGGVF